MKARMAHRAQEAFGRIIFFGSFEVALFKKDLPHDRFERKDNP